MRPALRVVLALASAIILFTFAQQARARRTLPPWWVRAALCVHSHEGSWQDSGAPYWGGLQMDMNFMRHYGWRELRRWGTAEHWTPHTQLVVAYRGWRAQGWGAWPNTARICGLI